MRLSKTIFLLGLQVTIPIVSLAQLKADFIADKTIVCSGTNVIFTDKTTGITGGSPTYSWNFGTGAIPSTATGVGPHTVTYSGSGTSTVSLTVTDGVNISTETKANYITINPLPTANAGPALAPICQGGTSAALGGTVGGSATGGIWSDGGISGTFLPVSTNLNATWTPPASYSGTATLTLTTTGETCGTATASKQLVVNPNAVITLTSGSGTNVQAVCLNIAITNITYSVTGGGTGANASGLPTGVTGLFSGGIFTISGTPSVSGTFNYTVTTTGTCTQATATGTIIVYALPTATAANNGPVCPGTSLNLTGGPGGMIAYSWTGPDSFSSSIQSPQVSSSATSAMAGLYTLTVTNSNGCQRNATTTVIVRTAPSATASNNGPVCVGSALSLSGGPALMSDYSWSGPNGFTSKQRNPQVSANATLAMAGTYTLTVTDGNGCLGSASTAVVVNELPVATAANNGPVCIGTPLTLTGGPNGMSSYSWSGPNSFTSNLQSPTVSSNATSAMAGNYILTVTNATSGCMSTATTTVVVNALPAPTATNNGPVCVGASLSLTGGPSGLSSYSWAGPNGFTSASQSPVVSSGATSVMAGVYTLTVTNANGCRNSATTTAVVNPLPVATALNNGPVCAGSPLTLSGGPSGMSSYSWTGPNGYTSNIQNPTVSLLATLAMAGTYTLTVVNNNSCQNIASTTVVVNALPVAVASNNGPVCSGKPLSLTGGPAGMTTYLWTGPNSFTSSLQSPTVSAAATTAMSGTYTLTVTNSSGCQSIATSAATVNQSPVATAINNGPVCVGSPLSLTGGPTAMTTFSWTGPNSFTSNVISPTVSPTATLVMAGVYTLTVTNSAGCQDTATTRAYVYTVPVSNAGRGGTECDLNFIFSAVPSVGTGLWTQVTGPGTSTFSPGANSATATVTVSVYGTYTFRWTETNGPCSSSAVITVNFYRQPDAIAGLGGNECDLNFVLNAVPSVGTGTWRMSTGTGIATFSPGANTSNATVTLTTYGTKVFTWTEINGTCRDSAAVTVNFYQQPIADAGTGGNNCGTEFNLSATPSIGLGTWTRDSGPGIASFTPNANTATAKATVTAYGTHVFRWTEVNGTCTSSATVSVNYIQQPSANAGHGGDECDLNFILNAIPGMGVGTWTKVAGPGTVIFSPNANQYNATVTVSQFGAYDFAWTEVNSLCTSGNIIRVTFHDVPKVNAGNDLLLCKGKSIQLNASGTGSFSWAPVAPLNNPYVFNPVANPVSTTLFTVTLTDQWGCKNSDQVNVEVRAQPVSDAGPDQVLEFLFETYLQAVAPGTNQTGEWTPLKGEGIISEVNNPSSLVSDLSIDINSFIWNVSNGICPVSSDTVNIIVHNLVIPTLITPNLDGKNDFFIIKGIESFGQTSLTVFNRWGAKVYENDKYDNSWDGVDDNENPLPEDTYFFILKPEKRKIIKGYVVLRR